MAPRVVSRRWFERHPELVEEIRRALRAQYPTLHLYGGVGDYAVVRGTLPISSLTGAILDRWTIAIDLPDEYPKGVPQVREVGHRIPWTSDFHMNPNGTACVVLPDEWCIEHPDGAALKEFLDGPVLSFFLGQSLRALGRDWPFGEWGHGDAGIYQFYGELFAATDPTVVVAYLQVLASFDVKGHWACPCQSGLKIRKCRHHTHLGNLRRRVPRAVARDALTRLGLPAGYRGRRR